MQSFWRYLAAASFFCLACPASTPLPPTTEPVDNSVTKEEKAPDPVPTEPKEPAPVAKKFPYPDTRAENIEEEIFGVKVRDPYRWLENVKSPEVKTWMQAQDKLTRDALAKFPGREALAGRLKELYYVDAISAPLRRKNRFFYTRTHADKENPSSTGKTERRARRRSS